MERLEIIGNLTADPEMRTTQSGSTVCSFTVAVNQPPTKAQRDSGQQPPAKFFRVSAWETLGDNCQKYLAKGRKVFVAGTIRANAYMGSQDNRSGRRAGSRTMEHCSRCAGRLYGPSGSSCGAFRIHGGGNG